MEEKTLDTLQYIENRSNEAAEGVGGLSNSVLDDVVGMAWQRNSKANNVDSAVEITNSIGGRLDGDKCVTVDSTNGNASEKLDDLKIIDHPSPNRSNRNGQPIKSLVLHYTAEPEGQALKHLCDPNAGVSAHYLVGKDGTVWHLVNESEAAWHAGYSYWDGLSKVNSTSVGIEIANMGNEPYPEAQMKAVAALSKAIIERHNIEPSSVIGHSDVALTRKNLKSDPGWFFDWKGLAEQGIGVWPKPEQTDYDSSKNWSDAVLKQKLNEYGYTAEADLSLMVRAFQRHFQPELAKFPNKEGIPDAETRARLAWLLRNKSA